MRPLSSTPYALLIATLLGVPACGGDVESEPAPDETCDAADCAEAETLPAEEVICPDHVPPVGEACGKVGLFCSYQTGEDQCGDGWSAHYSDATCTADGWSIEETSDPC